MSWYGFIRPPPCETVEGNTGSPEPAPLSLRTTSGRRFESDFQLQNTRNHMIPGVFVTYRIFRPTGREGAAAAPIPAAGTPAGDRP